MGEAKRRKAAGKFPANEQQESRLPLPSLDGKPTWALSNSAVQGQLEARFRELGVDPSQPGFHDSAAFIAAEARDPHVMDAYARFVEARTYGEAELEEAQQKICAAAKVVSEATQADGRTGLCVVASGVLSRMLDELGVWNYCAKTTLTVTFPPNVSLEPRYFYVLDEGDFVAAHAVVVAPPFVVVDATVRQQAWDRAAMAKALPKLVLQRELIPYTWRPEDIASPDVRRHLAAAGHSVRWLLERQHPHMLATMAALPARIAAYSGGQLRYVVNAVGGYQEKLRQLAAQTTLAGMSPAELFDQRVAPLLRGS